MTNPSNAAVTAAPEIVLGRADHQLLSELALAGAGNSAEDADGLLYELDRAKVVADSAVPGDVVRMGSRARFRTNGGDDRAVELVYPKDADIEAGRVSVLTPIGTALIGLRSGQSIDWVTRNGRKQVLTVLEVTPPEPDDEGPAVA